VTTLEEAASLARHDRGLVVISTLRANGTIQASLVNAGVIAHPARARPSWDWSPPAGSSWPTSAHVPR
jgi:hypothetical protein